MLEKLITQLGHELSMEEEIVLTADRHYLIPFENDIEVEAIELEKSYLLKSIIGNLPKNNIDSFLHSVMEANLFGMGTRNGVIGLDEEGKQLTLSMELDYNNSFKDFHEKLEDFVSVVIFWRNASQTT